MGNIENGDTMSVLCPHCNNVYSAGRLFMTGGICPCCGKKVGRSSIIFAFSEIQSFNIAMMMKKEKEEELKKEQEL